MVVVWYRWVGRARSLHKEVFTAAVAGNARQVTRSIFVATRSSSNTGKKVTDHRYEEQQRENTVVRNGEEIARTDGHIGRRITAYRYVTGHPRNQSRYTCRHPPTGVRMVTNTTQ